MKSGTARKSAAERFILASHMLELSLILKIRQKYTEISFPARNLISKTASQCPKIRKIEANVPHTYDDPLRL